MTIPFVIAINGKLGSGKDYICKYVIEKAVKKAGIRYLPVAFADQIKVNVMTNTSLDYHSLYIQKSDISRRFLQTEGTNHRNVNKNIWIDYMHNWITVLEHKGIQLFIITDLRYKNELDYITSHFKHRNILIKVIAEDRTNKKLLQEANGDIDAYNLIKNHTSECELDDTQSEDLFDFVVDNSSGCNNEKNLKKLENDIFDILKYIIF